MVTPEQKEQILKDKNFINLFKKQVPPTGVNDSTLSYRERAAKLREGTPAEDEVGFFGRVKEKLGERVETIEEKADMRDRGEISTFSQVVNFASQGFGALGDTAFEALVSATPDVIKDKAKELGSSVLQTDIGKAGLEAAKSGVESWDRFKQENPEIATNIESLVNFAEVIPVEKALSVGAKATGKVIGGGIDLVKKTAKSLGEEVGGVVRSTRELAETGKDVVGELGEKALKKEVNNIDDLTGRIIQGKPEDIKAAKRALADVDTTNVKTYKELGTKINKRIDNISKKLNEFLDEQPGLITRKASTITEKVGKRSVKQNFVDDAFEQLEELYTKVKEPKALAEIQNLKDKFNADGLTKRELNDLSKTYGREFGSKAFSKVTGDPLTSVNAQAFENTRKGIKTTVRDSIEGDVAKSLDASVSDLIRTKDLVGKMEKKVNTLYQKVKERGLFEQIANKAGTAIDLVTLRTLSGFMSRLLPSNVGLKTMNSLDIQEQLAKNLKRFDELIKEGVTDKKIVNEISDIVEKEARSYGGVKGLNEANRAIFNQAPAQKPNTVRVYHTTTPATGGKIKAGDFADTNLSLQIERGTPSELKVVADIPEAESSVYLDLEARGEGIVKIKEDIPEEYVVFKKQGE